MIAESIYVLCAVTSLFCFVLLCRGYLRMRTRILLCSTLAFLLFTLSNLLLVIDLVFLPATNLLALRNATTLIGVLLLLWGLIANT